MGKPETNAIISDALLKLGVSETPLSHAILFRALVREYAEGCKCQWELEENERTRKAVGSVEAPGETKDKAPEA